MNHKKWIRLVCTVLALLLFVTGSGVSFAMAEQPDKETVLTEEQAATPETAESARLSLTVLDSDYSGSENGNIDESLFNTETDHAEIAAGKIVPLLLQVDRPAQGSNVTVKLDKSAQFCDPRGQELSGQEWKRTFQQESQSAWMLYVTSGADFTVTAVYEDQSGNRVTRTADIVRKAAPTLFRAAQARSTTQYHITDVSNVGGEWLITFEGENGSYCMDEGLNGRPTSSVYWTYYGTTDLLDKAAAAGCTSKLDVQRYVWAHRGEASDSGSAYVYAASESGWQNVVTRYAPPDLPTEPGELEEPEQPEEYYASWEAPSQSASGSFDMKFTVNTDKVGLDTGEKVDGAKITITPTKTSGSVDGGSWQMNPAGAQTIITSGHTPDDNYQSSGGDGTVTWTVHYSVSKTSSSTLSGQVGPFSSQDEADAAAEEAKNAAVSQLQNEAQSMVDQALAAARSELATVVFQYDEEEIPLGYEAYNGDLGSHQSITVPADSANEYVMRNDEWNLQINLKKVDSETGQQIAADAAYEVYEWDTVTQKYIPYCGYNQYTVVRNEDGTYSVANGSAYASGDPIKSRTMYYTQRNEGRFLIVETRAPSGYYGDWTDVEHPGTAGTPLG